MDRRLRGCEISREISKLVDDHVELSSVQLLVGRQSSGKLGQTRRLQLRKHALDLSAVQPGE